jgi:hypothetical protein
MSTLHEEQHSDNDDDAKSDDRATPERHDATSKASRKEDVDFEASQVSLDCVIIHFYGRMIQIANIFISVEIERELFFLFKSFYYTIFCLAWQSNQTALA